MYPLMVFASTCFSGSFQKTVGSVEHIIQGDYTVFGDSNINRLLWKGSQCAQREIRSRSVGTIWIGDRFALGFERH